MWERIKSTSWLLERQYATVNRYQTYAVERVKLVYYKTELCLENVRMEERAKRELKKEEEANNSMMAGKSYRIIAQRNRAASRIVDGAQRFESSASKCGFRGNVFAIQSGRNGRGGASTFATHRWQVHQVSNCFRAREIISGNEFNDINSSDDYFHVLIQFFFVRFLSFGFISDRQDSAPKPLQSMNISVGGMCTIGDAEFGGT